MDIDAQRAQRLFQAVVTQALIDATAETIIPKSLQKAIRRNKAESDEQYAQKCVTVQAQRMGSANKMQTDARDWLLNDMASFPEIVSLAGYNPIDIRERARKLAKGGWQRPGDLADHALAA